MIEHCRAVRQVTRDAPVTLEVPAEWKHTAPDVEGVTDPTRSGARSTTYGSESSAATTTDQLPAKEEADPVSVRSLEVVDVDREWDDDDRDTIRFWITAKGRADLRQAEADAYERLRATDPEAGAWWPPSTWDPDWRPESPEPRP